MTRLRNKVEQLRAKLVADHGGKANANAYAHAMMACADMLGSLLATSSDNAIVNITGSFLNDDEQTLRDAEPGSLSVDAIRWLQQLVHRAEVHLARFAPWDDAEDLRRQAEHDRHDRDTFLQQLVEVRQWNALFRASPHVNMWPELDAILARQPDAEPSAAYPPYEVARAADYVKPYVAWDEEDYEIAQFVRRCSTAVVGARRIRLLREMDEDDRRRDQKANT
jgi:hypothetical protein